MPSKLEILARILLLPAITVAAAYVFGNNGFEAFIATCIGIFVLLSIEVGRAIGMVIRGRHMILAKLFLPVSLLIIWIFGLGVLMLVTTEAGHDPSTPAIPIHWPIAIITAAAYIINSITLRKRSQSVAQSVLYVIAMLYGLIILGIAASTFYGNVHRGVGPILVLAGQLQYIMTYMVVQLRYVERAVGYGQAKLGPAPGPFSLQQEKITPYMALAVVPFFVPVFVIMAAIIL